MEALSRRDREGLRRLAVTEPRALPHLVGRLWDPDPAVRELAAEALGEGAAAHPERGREILRRLSWALCDESGTWGGPAIAGIREIARRAPELAAPFLGALVWSLEEPALEAEARAALETLAREVPELVAGHREVLERRAGGPGRERGGSRRRGDTDDGS